MKNNLYYQDEYLKESFNFKMFRRLLKNAGKHKKLLLGCLFIEFATSALALLPNVLCSTIVEYIFPAGGAFAENWQLIVGICFGGVALAWASLVAGYYFEEFIPGKFGHVVCSEIRSEIFNHLTKLSFRYYDTHSSGKILVRVTNYVDELSSMFSSLFYFSLYCFGIVSIGVVWIFALDWRLGGAVILSLIPLGILMYVLSKELHNRAGRDHNKNSNYTAFVAENIGGAEVVRSYNRGALNNAAASEQFDEYAKAFMRSTRVREAVFPLAHGFTRAICTVVVYGVALAIILTGWGGALALHQVVAIASVVGEMSGSLSRLCEQLSDISTLTTNVERIYDTIDTPLDIADHAGAEELTDCKGDVSFENVSFSYVAGVPVLKNFNLQAKAGETVALVGATGSGKTTVVNLLSRFYDVTDGSIKIDGKDLRSYTVQSLRESVGAMMQDTFMFSGTVMENIRFARPSATDEECIAAAKAARADGFVSRLPQGYFTPISENGVLSGGERQLLSFARLILADPRIIVLDEATSHVDTQTEIEVQRSLKTLLKNRTSFVIAHRLSTIRGANKIVFMADGEIVEQGTHEELMRLNGNYAKLTHTV